MSRDSELDEVEKLLTGTKPGEQPFIERPDKLDLRPGILCWLDGSRVCGSDCVAFNVNSLDDNGQATGGPESCVVLCNMETQAASMVAAAQLSKRRQQDERRNAAGGTRPVPPVGGKKDR